MTFVRSVVVQGGRGKSVAGRSAQRAAGSSLNAMGSGVKNGPPLQRSKTPPSIQSPVADPHRIAIMLPGLRVIRRLALPLGLSLIFGVTDSSRRQRLRPVLIDPLQMVAQLLAALFQPHKFCIRRMMYGQIKRLATRPAGEVLKRQRTIGSLTPVQLPGSQLRHHQ